jgi:pimeloyl-ACP methyl ester carboxylesterase
MAFAPSVADPATVTSFAPRIEQDAFDDLARRLHRTRWPDAETVSGWEQGVPLAVMKQLHQRWIGGYDWRRCEERLEAFDQYRTEIDGCGMHFLHIRSPEPDALPLILTHGWPGSVLEFLDAAGPLADPRGHGRDPGDAFHLVIPSLPGYGFSDRPSTAGWTVQRIAQAWAVLMERLGYTHYVAQGGDWGSAVTHAMGVQAPPGLLGVHMTLAIAGPPSDEPLSDDDKARLAQMEHHRREGRGYSEQQHTRPQTIGYPLADSPIGQAAWIYEKYREWSDCDGDPLNSFTMDQLLDTITLYWLTNSGASSARLYWESLTRFAEGTVAVPVGLSIFPKEIFRPARAWAEQRYPTLRYWSEPPRGGHFAAMEVPDLFVDEVAACFRPLRGASPHRFEGIARAR